MYSPPEPKSSVTLWLVISISHAILGVFLMGYNTALFNVPQDTIRNHASQSYIEDFPWEIVNAMFPVGALIGAAFSGKMSDKYGRKKMILFVAVINIIASVVTGTSFYYSQLIIGRLITGVGSGAATVVTSAYLNEIAPDNLRGAIGTLLQLFITIAIVISEILGKLYENDPYWRMGIFACGVLSIIQLLLGFTVLESPKWLLNQNRNAEAIQVLRKLQGSNYASNPVSVDVKKSINVNVHSDDLNINTGSPSVEQLLKSKSGSVGNNKENESLFVAVRQYNVFKKVLFISLFLHILQQLSGINVVFYYSEQILDSAGFNNTYLGSVLLSTANFISTMIVIPVIDRWGRKPLLLLSSIGMAISSAAITVTFIGLNKNDGTDQESGWGVGMIICMVSYVSFFEFGLGPIPWLYVTEITPIQYRGTMVSLAQVANYTSNTIIALTSTTLLNALESYGFVPFGVICVVGSLIICIMVPETKQKTPEQIIKKMDPRYKRDYY